MSITAQSSQSNFTRKKTLEEKTKSNIFFSPKATHQSSAYKSFTKNLISAEAAASPETKYNHISLNNSSGKMRLFNENTFSPRFKEESAYSRKFGNLESNQMHASTNYTTPLKITDDAAKNKFKNTCMGYAQKKFAIDNAKGDVRFLTAKQRKLNEDFDHKLHLDMPTPKYFRSSTTNEKKTPSYNRSQTAAEMKLGNLQSSIFEKVYIIDYKHRTGK